jgi:DNA modification methylase
MTTARYLVGDVFARLRDIPDASVDLAMTSPPFLALRSYLPADHPDKHLEIGSEPTPAAFLDTLLALTAELGRVLAPHGSICVELGDSFAGSGGAGGDYDDGGWRNGQQRWGGSASRGRESNWSYADALWLAGIIDAEGSIMVHRQDRGDNSPSYRADVCISMMDRQVCDRAAEITGVGNVNQDGRKVYTWHVSAQQARYVLLNIWPHLLIKQRQACAAIELQRHIEDTKRRGQWAPVAADEVAYRETIRVHVIGWNARGEDRGKFEATWTAPTPPRIRHSVMGGTGWPMDKSLCGLPTLYAWSLAYGVNLLTGEPSPAGQWRVRNLVAWVRPNPPVGALGDKFRPATSYLTIACKARDRYFDLDAVRTPHMHPNATHTVGHVADTRGDHGEPDKRIFNNPAGAPPLDWWNHIDQLIDHEIAERSRHIDTSQRTTNGPKPNGREGDAGKPRFDKRISAPSVGATGSHIRRRLEAAGYLGGPGDDVWDIAPSGYPGAHYAVYPPELCVRPILAMTPRRVCTTCGTPSRRVVEAERLVDGATSDAPIQHPGRSSNGGGEYTKNHGTYGRQTTTLGWSECGHGTWRPGHVLDPFAGTGTTLAVATGHGRTATGIDIDPRNAELAQQRLGMFLTIDTPAEAS